MTPYHRFPFALLGISPPCSVRMHMMLFDINVCLHSCFRMKDTHSLSHLTKRKMCLKTLTMFHLLSPVSAAPAEFSSSEFRSISLSMPFEKAAGKKIPGDLYPENDLADQLRAVKFKCLRSADVCRQRESGLVD